MLTISNQLTLRVSNCRLYRAQLLRIASLVMRMLMLARLTGNPPFWVLITQISLRQKVRHSNTPPWQGKNPLDLPARGTTVLFTLLIKIEPWLLFDASVSTTEMVTCFSRRLLGRKAWRSPKNVCEEAKCSRDVETVGARPGCSKNKGFSSAQETNKNKKSFLS